MIASYGFLKQQIKRIIHDKKQQGYDVKHVLQEYKKLPDDYEAINQFSKTLKQLTYREDWPYLEPKDLDKILAQCELAPEKEMQAWLDRLVVDIDKRVEAAFIASVCGCILGKPVEVDPTLVELKHALIESGDWPLDFYFREETLTHLNARHPQWFETTRERIAYVAADDDINYTILGALLLENFGEDFSKKDIAMLWLKQLPIAMTYGPERSTLTKAAIHYLSEQTPSEELCSEWCETWNPGEELCGAMIRVDAYGYAFAGQPLKAVCTAYRDASFTHSKTGVYASMFIAACIAYAPVAKSAMEIFQTALKFVPKKSRFYHIVAESITLVEKASDWEQGYGYIHGKFAEYTHCQIYQEIGTLINSLCFANSVEEAICMQVSQGNDTDSFGATCGAIAGMYFDVPIDDKWLAPFNDELRTGLCDYHETSLAKTAQKMGKLPLKFTG